MTGRLIVSLLGLLLAGCMALGNSELANDATIAQIKVGETTRQQVAALLGEPTDQRSTELAGYSREWWHYRYAISTINPLEYLFLFGFLTNGIGLPDTRYDLHVFFDPNGTVTSLSRQTTSYDMGGPFSPLRVTSTAATAVGFAGRPGGPIRFEDKMEFRY